MGEVVHAISGNETPQIIQIPIGQVVVQVLIIGVVKAQRLQLPFQSPVTLPHDESPILGLDLE